MLYAAFFKKEVLLVENKKKGGFKSLVNLRNK